MYIIHTHILIYTYIYIIYIHIYILCIHLMLRQIQAVRYATYPGDGFVLDLALNLTGAQTRPGDHRDQGMDLGKTKGKPWENHRKMEVYHLVMSK